jgi:hypothetical protein
VDVTRGSQPEVIEASERESSKLDYQNVSARLRSSQRDALRRESITFEQRRLVKEYFEAIRK